MYSNTEPSRPQDRDTRGINDDLIDQNRRAIMNKHHSECEYTRVSEAKH
jgi:hypothetical protein